MSFLSHSSHNSGKLIFWFLFLQQKGVETKLKLIMFNDHYGLKSSFYNIDFVDACNLLYNFRFLYYFFLADNHLRRCSSFKCYFPKTIAMANL